MKHLGNVIFVIANCEKMKVKTFSFSVHSEVGKFYICGRSYISLKYISTSQLIRIKNEFEKRYQPGARFGNFVVKNFESTPARPYVKIELEFPDLVSQRARDKASRANWRPSARIPYIVKDIVTKLKTQNIYEIKTTENHKGIIIRNSFGICIIRFISIHRKFVKIKFELPPMEFFLNELLRALLSILTVSRKIDDFRVLQYHVIGARDTDSFDADEKHRAGEVHEILLKKDA
ncbi:MAG: hypothetical protein KGM15_15905 [Pseudomonadota bacterium]|nr:hypothetical protein [Pseudomonadota bacterium]